MHGVLIQKFDSNILYADNVWDSKEIQEAQILEMIDYITQPSENEEKCILLTIWFSYLIKIMIIKNKILNLIQISGHLKK